MFFFLYVNILYFCPRKAKLQTFKFNLLWKEKMKF